MRALKVFDLDVRGAAYVRNRMADLSEWGSPERSLCRALAETMESSRGRISTIAPPETSDDRLYRFEEGGLLPENLDMSRAVDVGDGKMLAIERLCDEELALLMKLLKEQPGRAGIAVDPLATRGDPHTLSTYSRTSTYVGDRVFHVVDSAADQEAIELALNAAPFWTNLWAVTSAPPKPTPQREISEEDLCRSATAAIAISCGAYDGEGFVFWQRA